MLESEARNLSMLAHILAIIGGFVAPLIIWLIYRDRSALVGYHGKEQLNFQISLIIYWTGLYIVATMLAVVTFGIGLFLAIPLMIALGIYAIVIMVVAGMAANRGEYYRIPLTIRFIS
jgi:uncharacterized Tic20 family protein